MKKNKLLSPSLACSLIFFSSLSHDFDSLFFEAPFELTFPLLVPFLKVLFFSLYSLPFKYHQQRDGPVTNQLILSLHHLKITLVD